MASLAIESWIGTMFTKLEQGVLSLDETQTLLNIIRRDEILAVNLAKDVADLVQWQNTLLENPELAREVDELSIAFDDLEVQDEDEGEESEGSQAVEVDEGDLEPDEGESEPEDAEDLEETRLEDEEEEA